MWKIIQELLPVILVVLFLTQYVLPILLDKPTWWLFRPSPKEKINLPSSPSTLVDEIKATKSVVDEAKSKAELVKEKVEGNLKVAEDLKKEADKLI